VWFPVEHQQLAAVFFHAVDNALTGEGDEAVHVEIAEQDSRLQVLVTFVDDFEEDVAFGLGALLHPNFVEYEQVWHYKRRDGLLLGHIAIAPEGFFDPAQRLPDGQEHRWSMVVGDDMVAMAQAMCVFPVPGRPHRMSELPPTRISGNFSA
jgi:hypothetical protein